MKRVIKKTVEKKVTRNVKKLKEEYLNPHIPKDALGFMLSLPVEREILYIIRIQTSFLLCLV
jgi:hypothetical protein